MTLPEASEGRVNLIITFSPSLISPTSIKTYDFALENEDLTKDVVDVALKEKNLSKNEDD